MSKLILNANSIYTLLLVSHISILGNTLKRRPRPDGISNWSPPNSLCRSYQTCHLVYSDETGCHDRYIVVYLCNSVILLACCSHSVIIIVSYFLLKKNKAGSSNDIKYIFSEVSRQWHILLSTWLLLGQKNLISLWKTCTYLFSR